MAWADTIKAHSVESRPFTGSFKGARFQVRSSDLEPGRRTQVTEYPLRDTPHVADLGRKARRFSIEVFVAGDDYLAERDALIAACESKGAGELVHPYYGTLRATCVETKVSERSNAQGRADITLTFIEGGDHVFPTVTVDTAQQVSDKADTGINAALENFTARWKVAGLPDGHLAQLEEELTRTLSLVENATGAVASSIAAEIRAPYNMGAAIIGSIQRISSIATEPLRALQLYQTLVNPGANAPSVPTSTTTRRQQAESISALHDIVRCTAIAEACRSASQATFASRDDALAARQQLLDVIATLCESVNALGNPISDTIYDAYISLRTAVATDLRERGAQLPKLTTYTTKAVLPALVVAHMIYGDASRADEIVTRNKLRHPGFVPAGEPLEVLAPTGGVING